MTKENQWQSRIVKKIKDEGGHARKMSHSHAAGVLDLMVVHKDLGTVFIEVKMIKPSNPDKFSLRMNFEETQKLEAQRINGCGGIAIGLGVVYINPSKVYFVLTNVPNPGGFVNVTKEDMDEHGIKWSKSGTNLIEWISEQLEGWRA